MTDKKRTDLQERLNVTLLRYAVLLQRAAVLADYLRENITATKLAPAEQNALEFLINITEQNLEFTKQRRQQLFNQLDANS